LAAVRENGTIQLHGATYRTPTVAAQSVTRYPVNGWHFWKYKRAPGDWVRLDELRK
jgi:Restriction Enzyme Adenine Methylase Associated